MNYYNYPIYYYKKIGPHGEMPTRSMALATTMILKAAEALDISWKECIGTKILSLSYQGKMKNFRYEISANVSDIGFYSCLDKAVTKSLLVHGGISVPKGFHLEKKDSEDFWIECYRALEKPLVIKPTHGNKGSCISLDIQSEEEARASIKEAFSYDQNNPEAGVIIEEQFLGKEYRILATREKILGVIERKPAHVIGDGQSTVSELVAIKNSDYRRDERLYSKIIINQKASDLLFSVGLTENSVPKKGEVVFLRRVSNISQGGDAIDWTDYVHPSVLDIALRSVNSLPNIDFVGLDLITQDITTQQTDSTYQVIEVNSSPGFDLHEFPIEGKRRFVALEFLCLAFPELQPKISALSEEQKNDLY